MARIETIPKPICEREGCDRTATVQVGGAGNLVLGRYCSAHGMAALRQADEGERETPKRATVPTPKEAVAR
jgi:hypothetical protein